MIEECKNNVRDDYHILLKEVFSVNEEKVVKVCTEVIV